MVFCNSTSLAKWRRQLPLAGTPFANMKAKAVALRPAGVKALKENEKSVVEWGAITAVCGSTLKGQAGVLNWEGLQAGQVWISDKISSVRRCKPPTDKRDKSSFGGTAIRHSTSWGK